MIAEAILLVQRKLLHMNIDLVEWRYFSGSNKGGARALSLAKVLHRYPNGKVDVLVEDIDTLRRAGLRSRVRRSVFVQEPNPTKYDRLTIRALRRQSIEYVIQL
jgi:hypothetical protein